MQSVKVPKSVLCSRAQDPALPPLPCGQAPSPNPAHVSLHATAHVPSRLAPTRYLPCAQPYTLAPARYLPCAQPYTLAPAHYLPCAQPYTLAPARYLPCASMSSL